MIGLKIDTVSVGHPHPCRFVVEVSNSHNGSLTRAHRMVQAAKDIGADFVKFQAYTAQELVDLRGDGPAPEPWGTDGWSMRTLYEHAATPLSWLPELFQHARDIGIVPFSSVFGLESLAALEKCACPAYKIARLDNQSGLLISTVRSRGKPVIISDNNMPEMSTDESYSQDVRYLYCPPGYPTPIEDVKLPAFGRGYKSAGFVGLSSHCLDPVLPGVAVALGAEMIEMHMELDFEPSDLEHNVCLTATEFKTMISNVRHVEAMLA